MDIKEIEKDFDEQFSGGVFAAAIKSFYRQRIKDWALFLLPTHDVGCEIQHTGKCSCPVGKMEDNILKQFEV